MTNRSDDAESDALRGQLVILESQREQLASLLDGNVEGPMQQLQEELNTAIDAILQRLGTAATGTPTLPVEAVADGSQFAVGDMCLAPRVFDRRRALALVEAVDVPRGTCLVTWVHPRQKREIVCRYWKEGRTCKFSGRDCSFSHGIEVPLADLLPDSKSNHVAGAEQASSREPSETEQWLTTVGAGSRLLARFHDRVWYDATAEGPSVNGHIAVCFTGFEDEGCVFLPADLSHLAPPDDQVDDAARRQGVSGDGTSDEEDSDFEDAWAEEIPEGDDGEGGTGTFFRERVLGDRKETAGGVKADGAGSLLTDAYVFGDWEQHTKGFGSRMMSRMGYRRGEGLGKEKQGISRPVPIRVLPERRALDHLRVDDGRRKPRGQPGPRKKKSKPGKCSSDDDDGEPQKAMFDFLNVTIHASAKDKGGAASFGLSRSSLVGRKPVFEGKPSTVGSAAVDKSGGASAVAKSAGNMTRSQLRSHLVGAREAEAALTAKATRLEETVARNSERDPRIAAAARQKLEEVRVQAREVRASMDQAERVLGHRKDKGKGGGKGGLFSF